MIEVIAGIYWLTYFYDFILPSQDHARVLRQVTNFQRKLDEMKSKDKEVRYPSCVAHAPTSIFVESYTSIF